MNIASSYLKYITLSIRALTSDPVSAIQYLSEKAHERNKFLKPAELVNLVESSRKTRAMYYLPVLIYIGAEHGASKQESLSLLWEDIDFEFEGRGLIHLFRTKNGHERTEYLMPRTREALLEWRDHLNYMFAIGRKSNLFVTIMCSVV